jgi:chloramphenicol 3-O-phosphotransferase
MADSIGQMVLLNGTSSSGKTSLARALQSALLPEIWLHIDVDLLRKSHPDPTFAAPAAVEKGIAMEKLLQAIPDCMAALLRSVSTPGVFDLEVETAHQTPQSAANLVLERLKSAEKPDAFARLSELDLAQIVAEFEAR